LKNRHNSPEQGEPADGFTSREVYAGLIAALWQIWHESSCALWLFASGILQVMAQVCAVYSANE
jgi:hypothetical protein